MTIDALKRQFAITQDEQVLKVLRDALVEFLPVPTDGSQLDGPKWVAEQIGIVQERWHSLQSLKATAQRHLREDAGVVNTFVLARIKTTQKYTGVFAGDVVLVSPMPEPSPAPLTKTATRYFRQYRIALAPTEGFELLNDDVAQDLPTPQPPMKIELKKFVANQRFSEETLMFRAEIWIDGKKVGSVENDGRGGSNAVHYTPAAVDAGLDQRVHEYLHALPPDISMLDDEGHPAAETGRIPRAYTLTEDFYFGMLAEAEIQKKNAARMAKWLQKQAEKIRAAGMQPRKFVIRKRNGTESITVVPFPNPCTAKAIDAEIKRLSKGGATVTGGEAL